MSEYFKGWRRKAGLVTLAMALAFFFGRLRSETYSDSFSFPYGTNTRGAIESENGYLLFESTTMPSPVPIRTSFSTLFCCDPNECYLYYRDYRDEAIGWRSLCFAFGTHEVIPDNSHTEGPRSLFSNRRTWFLSYWTMVLPLTLLSAWLILCKPWFKLDGREIICPSASARD
jgi:hypothetical protein